MVLGIDAEDVQYLKRTYDMLLLDEKNGAWLNDTHWVDHVPTNIPNFIKRRKDARRVHVTGCARSEGLVQTYNLYIKCSIDISQGKRN